MRVRLQSFGSWVRINEPAALVALSRADTLALGLASPAAFAAYDLKHAADPGWEEPLEAHLAVTARCGVGCHHCYMDAKPEGHEPTLYALCTRIDELASRGVMTLALGGGEPLLRNDLDLVVDHARKRGLLPVLTTSGVGLTQEKATALRGVAQINVSFDGNDAVYTEVRGINTARAAERAIAMLSACGHRVGVNVVLTHASFAQLEATLERALALGACEAQLLRLKPAGRGLGSAYLERRLTAHDVATFARVLRALSLKFSGSLALRIDCALVPFLAQSDEFTPEILRKFGIFGCEAGRHLEAIRADGSHASCSFLTGTERVSTEREAPCSTCAYQEICRGGCSVVSRALLGRDGPDPECPRVTAHGLQSTRSAHLPILQ